MEQHSETQAPAESGRPKAWWSNRAAWRPSSFYLMFAIPVVLLLGLHMFQYRDNPRRFALILALMFAFFGIVLVRAIMDMFEIGRKQMSGRQSNFRETLGAPEFLERLGKGHARKNDQ